MASRSRILDYDLPELTAQEWGYIAGFFDGEASFYKRISFTYKKKDIYHFRISMTHTHYNTLVWLCNKLCVGKIYERKGDLGNFAKKTQYHFDISPRLATYKILKKLIPILREKKNKAIEIVRFIDDNNLLDYKRR